MKESFDYKEVPEYYLHCLHAQCPRSSDCLRYKAAVLAGKEVAYFKTVNPAWANEQEECRYFHPARLTRYASGITRLYNDLPHTKYLKIKKIVHNYFGHTHYYRIYNKLRFIKPEDQTFIRELFMKEGIETEPLFDEYVEKYDFS